MNSVVKFTVRKVFSASEKQKAIGIHATFNMTIDGPSGIIASLNDMKLCQRKDGNFYVQSPYRVYKKRNEDGQEVDRKVQFVKLWPEEKNWPKQEPIVQEVLSQLQAKSSPDVKPKEPVKSTSTETDNQFDW
jgi:hypothetical protein